MTLRKRTLLVIVLILLALLLVIYAISSFVVLRSFADLEREYVYQNVQRVINALSDDLVQLHRTLGDWSSWDDTYTFAVGENDIYVENNLMDETFANLRISLMLFLNNDGQVVYGKGFDLIEEQEIPIAPDWQQYFVQSALLSHHTNVESQASGFVLFPEGSFLVASRPILDSFNEGPIHGTLIMGRYLGTEEIERLESTTRVSLDIRRFDDAQVAPDFQAARESLSQGEEIFIRSLDRDTIAGYALLKDIEDKPALVLRVDMPRDIYRRGQTIVSYFTAFLLIVGIVFGIVMLWFLERQVLTRLSYLSQRVQNIGFGGKLAARIKVTGQDELSDMTVEINTMLEALERSQIEILRLQHLLQNITDSMPSALIALDLEGYVLTWNPAAEALTGRTVDEVSRQPLWQICPELKGYRDLVEQVLRERRVAHLHRELVYTKQAESAYYRNVDVFPLVADDLHGIVMRIDDVTQWVQLEEMMLQSAKMASIGGLAAGIAHELNNPLGAMLQSAQMVQLALDVQRPHVREYLAAHDLDPENLDDYLKDRGVPVYLYGIRETGVRAAKIVTDLLNFSRKSASKVAPHDLNQLVEQTLTLAATDYDPRKSYDFQNIEIVWRLALDLPQVICNGQQIQQVILNLVRNAAQAMMGKDQEDYHPCLILRTSLRKEDAPLGEALSLDGGLSGDRVKTWVRLEVEDNGPGIPEPFHKRLFTPFFTTKEVGEGTGLGLWLCWSIIERHKGRIWAEPVLPPHREDEAARVEQMCGARFVVELSVS